MGTKTADRVGILVRVVTRLRPTVATKTGRLGEKVRPSVRRPNTLVAGTVPAKVLPTMEVRGRRVEVLGVAVVVPIRGPEVPPEVAGLALGQAVGAGTVALLLAVVVGTEVRPPLAARVVEVETTVDVGAPAIGHAVVARGVGDFPPYLTPFVLFFLPRRPRIVQEGAQGPVQVGVLVAPDALKRRVVPRVAVETRPLTRDTRVVPTRNVTRLPDETARDRPVTEVTGTTRLGVVDTTGVEEMPAIAPAPVKVAVAVP